MQGLNGGSERECIDTQKAIYVPAAAGGNALDDSWPSGRRIEGACHPPESEAHWTKPVQQAGLLAYDSGKTSFLPAQSSGSARFSSHTAAVLRRNLTGFPFHLHPLWRHLLAKS